MTALVGVVPAAGYATRLQPLRGSKEMIAVDGRPVVDFLLDRLRAAPCDAIRVVTRPAKTDLVTHAERLGLDVVLAEPASVTESLLAGVSGLGDEDVVCFGFPDTLWEPRDGFARLVGALSGDIGLALGLFRGAELERCDVTSVGTDGRVLGIDVKPARPRSPWIWGCAAARADVLRAVDDPEPGVYFDRVARDGPWGVTGVPLGDEFRDIGTPSALAALGEEPAG
ncbi:MAG TPA: NTP transferase domain-containing protein [Gaiellaceae bacterium]